MAFRLTRVLRAQGGFMEALGKWTRDSAGYRQLGLLSEDLIREEIDGVKEALTRLPQEEQDKRYFRIKRAMHLDGKDAVLPKDQWVTEATDVKYLSPLINQVQLELKEKEDYDHRA